MFDYKTDRTVVFSCDGDDGEEATAQTVAFLSEELGFPESSALGAARFLLALAQDPQPVAAVPLLAGVPTPILAGTGLPQTVTVPESHPRFCVSAVAQTDPAMWSVSDAAGNTVNAGVLSTEGDGARFILRPGYTLTVIQPNTGQVLFSGFLSAGFDLGFGQGALAARVSDWRAVFRGRAQVLGRLRQREGADSGGAIGAIGAAAEQLASTRSPVHGLRRRRS